MPKLLLARLIKKKLPNVKVCIETIIVINTNQDEVKIIFGLVVYLIHGISMVSLANRCKMNHAVTAGNLCVRNFELVPSKNIQNYWQKKSVR